MPPALANRVHRVQIHTVQQTHSKTKSTAQNETKSKPKIKNIPQQNTRRKKKRDAIIHSVQLKRTSRPGRNDSSYRRVLVRTAACLFTFGLFRTLAGRIWSNTLFAARLPSLCTFRPRRFGGWSNIQYLKVLLENRSEFPKKSPHSRNIRRLCSLGHDLLYNRGIYAGSTRTRQFCEFCTEDLPFLLRGPGIPPVESALLQVRVPVQPPYGTQQVLRLVSSVRLPIPGTRLLCRLCEKYHTLPNIPVL